MDKPTAILPGALAQYQIDKPATNTAAGTESSEADKNALGQQQFLDLMVTQLQNQDPFEPMESGDFLGQIAQFSTVSGIGDLKTSFETLAGSLQSNQALQASTMVGREVLVPVETFTHRPEQPVSLSTELPAAATAVRMLVSDAIGQVVSQVELGPQPEGRVQHQWTGLGDQGQTLPAGNYSVRFEAAIGGQQEALTAAMRSRVDSVSLSRDGLPPTLNLNGIGTATMNDVIEIL